MTSCPLVFVFTIVTAALSFRELIEVCRSASAFSSTSDACVERESSISSCLRLLRLSSDLPPTVSLPPAYTAIDRRGSCLLYPRRQNRFLMTWREVSHETVQDICDDLLGAIIGMFTATVPTNTSRLPQFEICPTWVLVWRNPTRSSAVTMIKIPEQSRRPNINFLQRDIRTVFNKRSGISKMQKSVRAFNPETEYMLITLRIHLQSQSVLQTFADMQEELRQPLLLSLLTRSD